MESEDNESVANSTKHSRNSSLDFMEDDAVDDHETITEDMDQITRLKIQINNQRKTRAKQLKVLESEKSKVYEAKKTISQLIQQITDYKAEMEEVRVI